ncbi:MAG: glycosyltransferase family 39 protein [Candidatus Tritonobacter lacicola]|nr:glycosyltransferase family 39 protein [Candidatus Tritonobacter lacicola]
MKRGVILSILALSVVLRLYGLGGEAFWFDEATTLLVAERDPCSLVGLCSSDNVPPLYYLVLHFWLYAGTGEVWVRLLSVAFGVATVYMVWRLGNSLAGYPAGAYSSLIAAFSPVNIAYSREARMYSMVEFWVAASFLFLWAWVREGRRGRLAGCFLCSAAALYTHLFGVFIVLAQNVFVLFFSGVSLKSKRQWLVSQVCLLLLFMPWMVVVARQVQRIGEDFWLSKISLQSFLSLWHFLGTGCDFGDDYVVTALLNTPLVILFCSGLFCLLRRRKRAALMLSLWFFVPVVTAGVIGLIVPVWLNRYLLIVSPAYVILIGSALAGLRGRLRLLVSLLVIFILAISLHYRCSFVSRTRVRPAFDYIEERYRPGDCIIHHVLKGAGKRPVIFDGEGWATFTYFPSVIYHRGRYPEFLLSREPVPFYLRGELLDPGEVVTDFGMAAAGYERVWLVSWAKYEPVYGDEAVLALAGPDFHLVTSLKFPSPGNDIVTLYLLRHKS